MVNKDEYKKHDFSSFRFVIHSDYFPETVATLLAKLCNQMFKPF